MRAIKLHFTKSDYLTDLLKDTELMTTIDYLRPNRLDDNTLALFDPVSNHSTIDTEDVVLSVFATAIKRVFFPKTPYNIEFINPGQDQQKGGLVHYGERIIDSTETQIVNIQVE